MRPAIHPVTNIQPSIGAKLRVRRQDAPEELRMVHHLKACASRFYRKAVYPAAGAAAAKIAQEEMVAIRGRKSCARIMRQTRRAVGDVPHRRQNPRGLPGKLQIPKL